MTQLSPHFSLEEMCFSQTAVRKGINNIPADPVILDDLTRTANGLERVRQHLNNNAIRVSSGYRSPLLERAICDDAYRQWCLRRDFVVGIQSWNEYLRGKQHPKGQAVDFTSIYGPPALIVKSIKASGIEYDTLALEYPGEGGWVHISFSDDPRRQTLVIDAKGTRLFQ
jgi:hypothetical protein